MINLNDVKAPGWARVVAELASGAPDDRAFFERILRVLAQVSAASQAALMLPDRSDGEEVEPRVASIWPSTPSGGGLEGASERLTYAEEMTGAARSAFADGQAKAFGLDRQDMYYGPGPAKESIIAVPLLTAQGRAVAVVAMLIEPRSKEALRFTLAMCEVLAGYVHGHSARLALRETQRASFALDLATRLIASLNQASGFKGATIQICNDIAKQFGVDRVGLGWVKGDQVKLVALSDTEHIDRRMAMVNKLEAAMDECYDQDQPVLYPEPPETGEEGDVLLSQAIVHAHRELASGSAKLRIASMPLRVDEDVVGVVTIESTGDGQIDARTIEMLQAALDLVGPVLKIRRSDDRMVVTRTWHATMHGASWLVGPRHTAWKLAGIGFVSLILFLTFFKTEYLVTAEATIVPEERRIVSMPREGVVQEVPAGIEIGERVVAEEVLAVLDSKELELSRAESEAQMYQAQRQADHAREEGDAAAAERYELEMQRARARVDLLDYLIGQSTIKSPIDGTILEGEMRERVGSTLKLGDPLFVIAPIEDRDDDLIVVARVDERDIGLVRKAQQAGQSEGAFATLATKSAPNKRHELRVERILQVAHPAEGKNVFDVRARIVEEDVTGDQDPLKPGTEGLVRIRTERHSLMWIGTRRVLDTIRLWLWK